MARFLAIGECMIEMARDPSGLYRAGVAGDTLNTAWYFRRATRPNHWQVAYFTRVGRDRQSDRIVDFIAGAGIETEWISRDTERQPGLYMIDLDNGERSFTYWRSQSAARLLADDEARLRDAMAASDLIYFSGITLAILAPDRRDFLIALAGEARRDGKTVAFDPNIRPRLWENPEEMRRRIMQAAAAASICLPSFDDERSAFADESIEASARRYLEAGSGEVVVKNAGGDVCVGNAGGIAVIGTLEQVKPVDTTGAGDSFNGGYLARRAGGASIRDSVIFAHELASQVVRHHGALADIAVP